MLLLKYGAFGGEPGASELEIQSMSLFLIEEQLLIE